MSEEERTLAANRKPAWQIAAKRSIDGMTNDELYYYTFSRAARYSPMRLIRPLGRFIMLS